MSLARWMLHRVIPRLTGDQRGAEVKALLRAGPPSRVVIDAALPEGAWYVVRGLATPQERAIAGVAAHGGDEWAPTMQMERDR